MTRAPLPPNYGWGATDPVRLMRWSIGVVVLAVLALVLVAVAAVVG